jgi:ABC-type multidrug transport system ATPase subunit
MVSGVSESIIEINDVWVRFRSRTALAGVSLNVDNGVVGLLGPNGAGKTTLLSVVAGLRQPASGAVRVSGHSVRQRGRVAGSVGYLEQNFGFMPGFTVAEFVTYAAWLKKVPTSDTQRLVSAAISAVQLDDRAGDKIRSLSGGMRRRAGIAAAMVHQPRVLLMDEPSAGLDPAQRVVLRQVLAALATTTAVLVSTHLIDDVQAMCSRVVVMNEGQVRFDGSPESMLSATGVAYADSIGLEGAYLRILEAGSKPNEQPKTMNARADQ